MNLKYRKSFRQEDGFTLIEIALAIVVVAIGVLAVFSLLSAGLDASNKAIGDTQAAIFADNVFNALRAESLKAASDYDPFVPVNGWNTFWQNFVNGSTNISVVAGLAWTPANLSVTAVSGGGTLVFLNKSLRGSTITDVQNYALRYELTVQPSLGGWGAALWENTAKVTLKVWNGQYGSTNNPLVFYSEFYNPGAL